ncbi:MAG: hypothetical protein LBE30_00185 [Comamonas sp.]|jgi:hypothetical protein|nr:hypothetical protein [Comamonas sp.]
MTENPIAISRWSLRFSGIAWFVAGMVFLLAFPMLLKAAAWALPVAIIISALLALPVAWVYRKFRKPKDAFKWTWGRCTFVLLFIFSVLFAAPIYYFSAVTQLRPALVPQVSLTNGDKTIVFQGMQHVGIERFYKSVVYDIEEALSRGDVIFYEGVRPSNPEADAWLNNIMTGGKDLSESYKVLGNLCGLKFQNDYFLLLGRDAQANPKSHVVADVSTLDLKHEYERLLATDKSFVAAMAARSKSDPTSPERIESLVRFLDKGTKAQRAMAGIVCRGFMTISMQSEKAANPEPLERVILDFRNKVLADKLLSEPNKHIFVTYGSNHLHGVLSLLQKNDPKWHVASVKWMRTIEAPEEYGVHSLNLVEDNN